VSNGWGMRRSANRHPWALLPGVAAVATAVSLLGLSVAGACPVLAASTTATYTVPSGTQGKIAGAAVNNLAPYLSSTTNAQFSQMAHDGLNTASLYVWWEADSAHADSVHRYNYTISDAQLESEIAAARAAGLHVSLVPIFWCNGCDGGFRGTLYPAQLETFFASYTAFVDHYATMAQHYGITTFWVGSEMNSLEAGTNEWTRLIKGVRHIFHGQLAYDENWNVLGNAHWLGLVDLIGVSAYFPLDPAANPSLSQQLGDWHSSRETGWVGRNWVAVLQRFQAVYRRPVTFGEVGYMSGQYAAAQPWLNSNNTTDLQLQSNLYQALLETFSRYSWWDGAIWWDFSGQPDGTENGRTFAGKLAESTLRLWYKDAERPVNPDSPLSGSGSL
jgi:hypothetical protein